MLAIETTGLIKRFGSKTVVDDLALHVPEGCIYGFLGPNGAGKTTTMRLLLGLLRPDTGTIRILGHDLWARRRDALTGVGSFIESASLYEHLSGRSNLDLARRLLNLPIGEIDRVLDVVDLGHAADLRVRSYSLGMKQRLALARALLGSPRLLLLDEPTNGLDPDGIVAMRTLIRELPRRIGGTVFVSSHLLSEVEQTAQKVCLLRDGRMLLQGSVEDLLATGAEWDLRTDRAPAGAALLAAAGMRTRTIDDRTIRLHGTAGNDGQVAAANRILVREGFAVCAILPVRKSLEDLYRQALTSSSDLQERRAA